MEYKNQIDKINEQTKPNKNKHVDTENRNLGVWWRGREKWVKGIDCMVM